MGEKDQQHICLSLVWVTSLSEGKWPAWVGSRRNREQYRNWMGNRSNLRKERVAGMENIEDDGSRRRVILGERSERRRKQGPREGPCSLSQDEYLEKESCCTTWRMCNDYGFRR